MKTTKTFGMIVLTGALMALAGCASSEGPWRTLHKPVAAAPPPACTDFQVSVYFKEYSAELIPEARQVLANARGQARGCAIKSVRVVGLADAKGSSDANLTLSKQRAQTVSSVLAKHGFAHAEIDMTAVGDAGAVANSSDPLRRRADIQFDLESGK
jgi:outer membrane protein OmpA-like peptidoglycan-associated protein